MNNDAYDLVVIGAGPAGTLAAATAAEAGLKTAIIELKSLPRQKLCGGLISSRALSLLPPDFHLPAKEASAIFHFTFIKNNHCYEYRADKPLGLLIERTLFDQLFAAYACQKGVTLIEEAALKGVIPGHGTANQQTNDFSVHFRTGGVLQIISTHFLIAADGAFSHCAELGGINRRLRKNICGQGLAELIPEKALPAGAPNSLPRLDFYPMPFQGGLGWAFYGNGRLNRGVGGFCGRSALMKSYTRLFGTIPEGRTLKNWPLPFLGPVSKAAEKNLLLIGDSAGLIEPFSGEGLYNCFKSAKLAVQAIREAKIAGIHAAIPYNRLYKRHFRRYFLPTLAGAVILTALSLICPSAMPQQIARLFENRLWFNDQNFDPR